MSAPTARIAGIAGKNTGTGVPGPAIEASLDGPSYVAFGADGSLYLVESAKSWLLRIHDRNITVAYTTGRNDGPIGGLAVGPTGKVVLLTVAKKYALTPANAQYFSTQLVGFLLALGGH